MPLVSFRLCSEHFKTFLHVVVSTFSKSPVFSERRPLPMSGVSPSSESCRAASLPGTTPPHPSLLLMVLRPDVVAPCWDVKLATPLIQADRHSIANFWKTSPRTGRLWHKPAEDIAMPESVTAGLPDRLAAHTLIWGPYLGACEVLTVQALSH